MQTPGQKWFRRRSKLTDFFGLKRNLVILLIAIFVIGAGEELWMRFVPKYLQVVGATVFVIGLYDALRTLLGAVYAYPGGIIVDHLGHRRAFIIFNVVSIAGNVSVPVVDLFFAPREFVAGRCGPRGKSPRDGRGCPNGC
jgi:MFS family permease